MQSLHCLPGAVVQLVRIPACHAGGRGFESRPLRHIPKSRINTQMRPLFYDNYHLFYDSLLRQFVRMWKLWGGVYFKGRGE